MADGSIPQKQCTRCKTVKPLTEFYLIKAKQRPRPACKSCDRILASEYQAPRRAEMNAQRRNYYAQHRAEQLAANRRWHAQYPKRAKELHREWYKQNQDKSIADAKKWATTHAEQHKATQRAYRASATGRMKRTEAEARRRARKRQSPQIEKINRAAIIARDNSTCYLCHLVLAPKQVALDHVIPLSRGGPHTADNLRVCCRSCNSIKRARLLGELQCGQSVNGHNF